MKTYKIEAPLPNLIAGAFVLFVMGWISAIFVFV